MAHTPGRVFTSVELTPLADDMRLWLAIVRYGWPLNQVMETGIRELAHSAGYDPNWLQDPRNKELAREWIKHHVRRPRKTPLLEGLQEQEHQEIKEEEDGHVEEVCEQERIEVYA